MVVVAGWIGQRRRAIARPELAVPAGLRGEIRQRGREVEVGFGCGERGVRGDFIGGLGLGEGLGFRAAARNQMVQDERVLEEDSCPRLMTT
jgi:hypothetical protein